ncbi:MAG TPA: PD-(D/E)XK motif protein [Desulfotomaculum sp.]|nr:MAG: Uncharacterized protein XD78_0828 [Desulfotomaculum sp. 46_296]HAG10722.1 PD-(D/E)XK motif protein [Desulfotomaculum sp.]
MKVTAELLKKQWDSISYHSGGFLRIDTEHPLEWYIGYQSINQKSLLVISDADIGIVDSSKSMVVKRGRRETDNRWTLTFDLLRNEQQGVFMNFCSDIIEYSRTAANSEDALDLVTKRYKQWSRLLEYQRKGLLDENSQKGLIGELIYLRKQLARGMNVLVAIQGWSGPDGGDQDFIYSDGWHEIKAVGVSAATVVISSLEQLDNSNDGELLIMRIDRCAPEKSGAFSLNNMVRTVFELLNDDPDAVGLFEIKLNRYGYIDLPEYAEQRYFYTGSQAYRVDSTFPKLTRNNVPVQAVSAQYSLSIAGLKDWER